MAERYLMWLQSEEGQAAKRESDARLADTERLLAKGHEIDWWRLYEHFTI